MSNTDKQELRDFLEKKVLEYNHHSFIEKDPVCIPHRFSKKQDIEIAGLFASVFAWGNRRTIIQKSTELMNGMDNAPHEFILKHKPSELKKFLNFKHRTFNATDLLYFVRFLNFHYQHSDTLESAFLPAILRRKPSEKKSRSLISDKLPESESSPEPENESVKNSLSIFYSRFFSLQDAPERTQKHIASPEKKSTCKRLNMYLRWMVRRDTKGVDFGIWKNISPADLICPVDLHVSRVSRQLGLISREQTDWETAMELTRALRLMDNEDPVKYDFALFSLGATEKY